MNIRYVNYNIQDTGIYDYVENIISINKYLLLSSEFDIIKEIEPEFNYTNRQYEGIEDIKLLSLNDKILFTGTCYKKNNNLGIAIGKYNKKIIKFNELTKDGEANCEKNWVFLPCGTQMIYKWFPLQVGSLINNKLDYIKLFIMPTIFKVVRGYTNGVLFNDEIWFIFHLVTSPPNQARIHYHMFVKFTKDLQQLKYSPPFKFTDYSIEYCCGLIVESERIIVSHSIWDRESYIKIYDRKEIEKLFDK